MSTPEQKVEVIREWLVRQAEQKRLTNIVEVQTWAGLRLAEQGYRPDGSSQPIERDDAWEALNQIAAQEAKKNQPLLPALVVHFADGKPGHRFVEWALAAGLIDLPQDAEQFVDEYGERRLPITDEVAALHASQVAAVFATYGPVTVPEDASSLA